MQMYKWQRFECVSTPVYMFRLYASGVKYRYTSAVNTAYLTTEKGTPTINGSGQFVWTGASKAQCSRSNYSGKFWASNNDNLRNGVAVGGVSDYFAVVTNFDQGLLGATLTHDIYETYINHYDYSQGSYVCEVTSNERTAYPDNGRHSDGYWYVYTAASNTVTAIAGSGISSATVQKLTNLLPAAVAAGTGGCYGYWGGSVGYTTKDGYPCISVTNNTGNQYNDGMISGGASLTVGKKYSFSGMINAPSGKPIRIGMRMNTGGNTENIVITGTGGWQSFGHTFTAISGMTGELESVETEIDSTSRTWYMRSLVIGEVTAGASSVDAFPGEALYFVASTQSGYNFAGWWNGSTKVCASLICQTELTSAENLTLTAKADASHTPLYVKQNGTYAVVQKVYKKIGESYVLQTDIQALFPAGIKLRKG